MKAPDWEVFEQWQQAAAGLIRIVTLSPEWDGAPEFISRCVNSGVTVSYGHTTATPEQIVQAVQAGATLSTHLGNGTHLTNAAASKLFMANSIHNGGQSPNEASFTLLSNCN